MTPFERLKTLVEWNLSDNVKEEDIKMNTYVYDCGTPGCMAGWGATCPELIAEGYRIHKDPKSEEVALFIKKMPVTHRSSRFLSFFGITEDESNTFFSVNCKGTKGELRKTWKKYLREKRRNSMNTTKKRALEDVRRTLDLYFKKFSQEDLVAYLVDVKMEEVRRSNIETILKITRRYYQPNIK